MKKQNELSAGTRRDYAKYAGDYTGSLMQVMSWSWHYQPYLSRVSQLSFSLETNNLFNKSIVRCILCYNTVCSALLAPYSFCLPVTGYDALLSHIILDLFSQRIADHPQHIYIAQQIRPYVVSLLYNNIIYRVFYVKVKNYSKLN